MKRVYLLRPVGRDGPIKIGCSQLPEKRLRDIMLWSPVPLELVASIAGGHALERELHERFAVHRLHGEWFTPAPALLTFLEEAMCAGRAEGIAPIRIAPRSDPLLPRIERFIRSNSISATRFGLEAMGDPMLVFQLRSGVRSLTARSSQRVEEYMGRALAIAA